MPQLGVVRYRDVLEVLQIPRIVRGLPRMTVELIGVDLSSAEQVFINDQLVSSFIIVSKTTIWAELPEGHEYIQSVSVLSSDFTKNSVGAVLSFKIGVKTRTVSGILKLSQLFTKWLLQTPGSDLFSKERGGGLQQIAGSVSASQNMQPAMALIARAVEKTASEIRLAQARAQGLPLDERLLTATILDIGTIQDQLAVVLRVQLDSMAGDSATNAVVL